MEEPTDIQSDAITLRGTTHPLPMDLLPKNEYNIPTLNYRP